MNMKEEFAVNKVYSLDCIQGMKIQKNAYVLFYPRGKNSDSVEMMVTKKRGNRIWAILSPQGIKEAEYFGWLFDLSGEIALDTAEVECVTKRNK